MDTADLAYDFDAPYHLGAIAIGARAAEVFGDFVRALDCRRLVIEYDAATAWVWLGSRRRIDPGDLGERIPSDFGGLEAVAVGEPGEGFAGWRLTHQQARAALPVARSGNTRLTRYADVVLLAAMLQDDLAATSLQQLYLDPLGAERDGGEVARDTLRAYFASQQNVTSAAAHLGINRNTVASRLRAIEERIGRPLAACGPELAVALRLDELSGENG
jgi:sugar diacid utilization regulator